MNIVAPVMSGLQESALNDIRVMVVDDSVVLRSLLSRWIGETPGLRLVAEARNGLEAIERVDRANPDVVVLDIEMPGLDGIETLPKLLQWRRDLVVLMASALTRDHAEITLRALALGAADYIPKPETGGGVITSLSFQRELIEKICVLGLRHRKRLRPSPDDSPVIDPAAQEPVLSVQRSQLRQVSSADRGSRRFTLRPFSGTPPRVLLIGASTGGPQALTKLMSNLDAVTGVAPVLITQHMPPTFTTVLAEHLSRAGARQVREAVDGEPVLTGNVYLAPGGKHMRVARRAGAATIVLDNSAPVHFCKPAVDPLFSSAAAVWGAWNLALILTGMGTDGRAGAADIAAAGGSVIAQDEATSVIWGMPGAAAAAGICSAVLPLDQLAMKTTRLFQGAGP
jgi:two-component system, chemotaxis family, protein-glutamate methylesterase/glutaminase